MPEAATLRKLDMVDALGLPTVEIERARITGLLHRLDPLVGDGIARADLGGGDRPAPPAPLVGAALVVLHAPEVRQHAGVVPPGRAELGPVIVVPLVPADEHHPVDRA